MERSGKRERADFRYSKLISVGLSHSVIFGISKHVVIYEM